MGMGPLAAGGESSNSPATIIEMRGARSMKGPKVRVLFLSQVYVPDPASVGQHMHDAAAAVSRCGAEVTVLCSNRGYDDPSLRYPAREERDGVKIRRLSFSGLGKASMLARLVGGLLFVVRATFSGLLVKDLDCVVCSTSPPMCGAAGLLIHWIRRVPLKYWVMDVNPDQVLAMGLADSRSLSVRAMDALNRTILVQASHVIALDHFMAERLGQKVDSSVQLDERLHVIPPWPHTTHLHMVEADHNVFVQEHKLQDRFVVMYSGNHSKASPITTFLRAALRLSGDERFAFLFVGGGEGKQEVDEAIANYQPANIASLPYQPLEALSNSLSAADVHVVTLGNHMVGIVHPCKAYGAMAIARPLLVIAPDPCHLSELLVKGKMGWSVEHGDVDGVVDLLLTMVQMRSEELREMGRRGAELISHELSQEQLQGQFAAVVMDGLGPPKFSGMS